MRNGRGEADLGAQRRDHEGSRVNSGKKTPGGAGTHTGTLHACASRHMPVGCCSVVDFPKIAAVGRKLTNHYHRDSNVECIVVRQRLSSLKPNEFNETRRERPAPKHVRCSICACSERRDKTENASKNTHRSRRCVSGMYFEGSCYPAGDDRG